MQFRGEFIRSDGLVIPNNVTIVGVRTILAAALRNTAVDFFVGLVQAEPDPELAWVDLIEPTIAVHGYARIAVLRSSVGWPTSDTLNNQPFLETGFLEWTASGGNFDHSIRRLALFDAVGTELEDPDDDESIIHGNILALSAAMPDDLIITPTTLQAAKRFKYRLYGA